MNLSQSKIQIKYHEKEHFPKFSIWPFQNLTDSDNQQTINIRPYNQQTVSIDLGGARDNPDDQALAVQPGRRDVWHGRVVAASHRR
jgi:hypothetical protein